MCVVLVVTVEDLSDAHLGVEDGGRGSELGATTYLVVLWLLERGVDVVADRGRIEEVVGVAIVQWGAGQRRLEAVKVAGVDLAELQLDVWHQHAPARVGVIEDWRQVIGALELKARGVDRA